MNAPEPRPLNVARLYEPEASCSDWVLSDEHEQQLLSLLPASASVLLSPLTDSSSSSSSDDRPRKQRKNTYTTRKEEAESMRAEVAQLTQQLSTLQRSRRQPHHRDAERRRATDFAVAVNANEYMRSLIQKQQQFLVGAQSVLSDWMDDEPSANPLTSYIHLTADVQSRRETLLAMKQQKLATAEQYMRVRNKRRSLFKPHKTDSQCETEEEDYYCAHADVVHFKGAESARQAYDALIFTMANMEISVAEQLGDITVREDYDTLKDGVANYRMRTWENPTIPQESNSVVFTQFFENQLYDETSDGHGYGVMVLDFVDQDDLHPYSPNDNIRRDITVACVLSMHQDPLNNHESVVVIQRAAFAKIHSTTLITDESAMDTLRKGIAGWCDVCLSTMRSYVCPS